MLELTDGQLELKDRIVRWYEQDLGPDFVYAGPAGTGKTSVLPFIVKELGLEPDEVLYCAFTGKAASVLMQKGFDASTIHSAFFDLKEKPMYDKYGEKIIRNGREVLGLKFIEKEFLSPRIKLIIADEWSMINTDLAKVMYKFGIPIIASGDEHQLQPVFGVSPFANKVQYRLTEITRQAQYSGIIILATMIREGKELPTYHNFYNTAHIMPKSMLTDKHLLDADIILTAKNKTRNLFNDRVRMLHNHKGVLPEVGDKLINRKNNWITSLDGIPLINGVLGTCIHPIRMSECNLAQGIYRMDFQPDYTDNYYEALKCDYDFLREPCGSKEVNMFNTGNKFEYAEAITVHLSQGSEYNNVLFYDEFIGDRDTVRKTRYTAVTRARESVYMFV